MCHLARLCRPFRMKTNEMGLCHACPLVKVSVKYFICPWSSQEVHIFTDFCPVSSRFRRLAKFLICPRTARVANLGRSLEALRASRHSTGCDMSVECLWCPLWRVQRAERPRAPCHARHQGDSRIHERVATCDIPGCTR